MVSRLSVGAVGWLTLGMVGWLNVGAVGWLNAGCGQQADAGCGQQAGPDTNGMSIIEEKRHEPHQPHERNKGFQTRCSRVCVVRV